MTEPDLNRLPIDWVPFLASFGRDVDFHDFFPQSTFPDRRTGDIQWVYQRDEDADGEGIPLADNRAMRERIKAELGHYIELPGLTHGEQHAILKKFLETECPEDSQGDYFGSIGGWIKSLDDESIKELYFDFRGRKIRQMGEAFLQIHGIEPLWR